MLNVIIKVERIQSLISPTICPCCGEAITVNGKEHEIKIKKNFFTKSKEPVPKTIALKTCSKCSKKLSNTKRVQWLGSGLMMLALFGPIFFNLKPHEGAYACFGIGYLILWLGQRSYKKRIGVKCKYLSGEKCSFWFQNEMYYRDFLRLNSTNITTPSIICNNCNTPNSNTQKYCSNCGSPLAQVLEESHIDTGNRQLLIKGQMKKCPKCAGEVKLEAEICPYCGYQDNELVSKKIKESLESHVSIVSEGGLKDVQQLKCYRHYTTNAVEVCAVCGNPLCDECARREENVIRCQRCVYEGRQPNTEKAKQKIFDSYEIPKYQEKAQEKVKQINKLVRRRKIYNQIGITLIVFGGLIFIVFFLGLLGGISKGEKGSIIVGIIFIIVLICAPLIITGIVLLRCSQRLQKELVLGTSIKI